MTEELKPVCCGCGGEAEVRGFENLDDSVSIYVCCSKCHTSTVSFTGDQAEANAVEAWNHAMGATDIHVGDKFAKDICVLDKVRKGKWKNIALFTRECSECGAQFHELEYDNFCPNCGADMRGKNEKA